jgi:hypothetical protein
MSGDGAARSVLPSFRAKEGDVSKKQLAGVCAGVAAALAVSVSAALAAGGTKAEARR